MNGDANETPQEIESQEAVDGDEVNECDLEITPNDETEEEVVQEQEPI